MAAAVAVALGAGLTAPAGARTLPMEAHADGSAVVTSGDSSFFAAQEEEQQRGPVSLEQAQKRALARFQGRVAGAKTVEQGGRKVHEIRIIGADNLVRTFRIDAQTGAFL